MRKAFSGISNITLRKKRYRVILAGKLGSENDPIDGDCSDPKSPGRIIRYLVGLKGIRRLDVFIHEMLHACFWDVREEGIEQTATDVARVLWRIGYRNDIDLLEPDPDWPNTVTLRGKRWQFVRISGLPTGHSIRISGPTEPSKFIHVRISLKKERELENIIRGLLIACYPDFDDEAIGETSRDIAWALWRIGYRRTLS